MIDRLVKRLAFKALKQPALPSRRNRALHQRAESRIGSYFKESNDALAMNSWASSSKMAAELRSMAVRVARNAQSRRSSFHHHLRCSKDCLNTNEQGANRPPLTKARRGPKNYLLERRMFTRFELAKSSTNAGCASRSRPFLALTTSCADSTICEMQESNRQPRCVRHQKS